MTDAVPPPFPTRPCVIQTLLEDGTAVCIRTIHADDADLMREGIGRMSDRSRFLRFFTGAKTPPDWVIERLLTADQHNHLAWGAIDMSRDDRPAIGAVHAFRDPDNPGSAEFSVAVLDAWHGLGLGKLLTATILLDAAQEGIGQFAVNVLHENSGAMEFTRSLGGTVKAHDYGVVEFAVDVAQALARLRTEGDPPGIADVFRVMAQAD